MNLLLFETCWMDVWEGREPVEPVGAIFTKSEITSLILDLANYRPETTRLAQHRLLEPSCGDGAFLAEITRRLIASERYHLPAIDWHDPALDGALTACDINSGFVSLARAQIAALLQSETCPLDRATALANTWIRHVDFLLTPWSQTFDFVVGNPPYVRIEDLPPKVLLRYRECFPTCADRADLYIAFFEQGLRLLSPRGTLAYICANRFAKNLYGRGLRQLIARDYHVRYYLNLEHTQPFVTAVSAYPCITVLDREQGTPTEAATLHSLAPEQLLALAAPSAARSPNARLASFTHWYPDGSPWIATDHVAHSLLARLERDFPTLENSAPDTKVGIGVATGADKVFVHPQKHPDIEPACQLPLLMAADIRPDALRWSGHHVINPFNHDDSGTLRDLARYPDLARYFALHAPVLRQRHVAKKRDATAWYRTIDRITASLTHRPKLVIPDIQSGGIVGYDSGDFYPHHNVYWVTSTGWNLRALQCLLRSTFVFHQVQAHSVQMRGGSVRYQAQVLRRLRVPRADQLTPAQLQALAAAATSPDQTLVDAAASSAFGL